MMEIEAGGVRCRYREEGEGPPVILLHGFTMRRSTWSRTIPALSRHFRVLAPDLPGFGESGKPPDFPYDLPGFTKWLRAFMDATGVARAALVGSSLGGGIAYTLATTAPDRVSSLVLVDSVGYQPRGKRFFVFRIMAIPGLGELTMLAMNAPVVRLVLRVFAYRDSRYVTREVVENYLAPLRTPAGRAAALRTIRMADFDSAPGPNPCRTPALVVWGAQDRIVPAAHAPLFARDVPGAKLHVFEDCGHFPQEERAEAFIQLVEPFLRQHA